VHVARILFKMQTNSPAAFMQAYLLPVQNYVHLQKHVNACLHNRFFSACINKTGTVRINVTVRQVRVNIVAVEKHEVLRVLCL
jgi:hypothetical protein